MLPATKLKWGETLDDKVRFKRTFDLAALTETVTTALCMSMVSLVHIKHFAYQGQLQCTNSDLHSSPITFATAAWNFAKLIANTLQEISYIDDCDTLGGSYQLPSKELGLLGRGHPSLA